MKLCVVLPTYNESATVREAIARALESSPDVDVLVVDDASPDGTGTIADEIAALEPRVQVVHRASKLGLGRAYIDGFRVALARGFDAVGEMDADLSHDPADLPRMLATLRDSDVVIGSRYVPGGRTENWSRARLALSRGANAYSRALLRFPMRDATSGFRIYRRAVLEEIDIDSVRSEGYAFQIEMAWRAWSAGFVVREVPIVFSERREGASKMSRRIVFEASWAVIRWAAMRARAPESRHPRSIASSSGRDGDR